MDVKIPHFHLFRVSVCVPVDVSLWVCVGVYNHAEYIHIHFGFKRTQLYSRTSCVNYVWGSKIKVAAVESAEY